MASTATYIAEWFRHHLSSAVTIQKQFVDDVTEKVKEQKAQFDRHTREAHDRAIQLHLDELEEKYLCCVCGRGGEAREDDEFVYDTYSMVELPPRMTLEAAVREELADAEMTDERIKQHQRELAVRQRRSHPPSARRTGASSAYGDDDDGEDDRSSSSSGASDASASEKDGSHSAKRRGGAAGARHRASRHGHRHTGLQGTVARAPASSSPARSPTSHAARQSRLQTAPGENRPGELAVMDPDMVGPLEVRNTLYKIRHAVLHKEARTRRKAVAVHKDKGLMKIEESEIDMFSHFFQRPVHGYLCSACYTSARRRLDSLTQQIRGILFKAQNPVLRRVSAKEVEALSSSSQVPLALVHSVLDVQRRWAALTEEERMMLRGADAAAGAAQNPAAALQSEERTSWSTLVGGETVIMGALSEKCILALRDGAKCGACQRRSACFFEQRSVVFLCQFCTARDRFYRENAVCINDEAMPLNLVHMLQDFSTYYQAVHQQMELRGAPQSAINQAQTDLFPSTDMLREEDGLFACLAPALASVRGEPGSEASSAPTAASEMPHVAPSTFAATQRIGGKAKVSRREQRERVGRTMVSLFDGVTVDSSGIDLFAASQPSAAAPAGTPVPASDNAADLFDFDAPTPTSGAALSSAYTNGSRGPAGLHASAPAVVASAPPPQTPTPPPNGAGSFDGPNPDWDSLF